MKKIFVMILTLLMMFFGTNASYAAETTLSGDDQSIAIAGAPSIRFDGVTYTNGQIFYSTNNVLTFGDPFPGERNEFDSYPGGPSISFNSRDWVVDWRTPKVDEFLTINTTANSISIDFAGRIFPLDGVGPVTTMQIVITVDGSNIPSYSYIVGGAPVTGGRSLCQLHDLSITNCAPITQDLNNPVFSSNALRVDAAGTTTLKDNVVSCTPGKYTFLNGGSTAETAKIQSYVYTLLVNGKAVSALSSDNFRSVASHLFPTIAGNMAGTATLEGATWDLKGMSNYSAQCQVYATQSSGNIQSVTTEAHDAVALSAQAEAAANVARDKEIISTWNAANEELAKKYRDQRLAVQP